MKCKNCIFSTNPHIDFTGQIVYGCSIKEPIVDAFGDSTLVTSNIIKDCKDFKLRKEKINMSKYFLVSYEEDYADEFDVSGMKIFTEEEYNSFLNNQRYAKELEEKGELEKDFGRIELYFGTNEFLDFNSVDEIIKVLKVQEITEQEFNILKKLDLGSFGVETIFDFFENIKENEDE